MKLVLGGIGIAVLCVGAWQGFQRMGLISPPGHEARITPSGAFKMTVNQPRAITWNALYAVDNGVALPTSTTGK